MKGEKVRALLKSTSIKAGAVVLATALVFGSGLWYENSRSGVPELVTFVDTDGSIEISEEEVPLGVPQVTTETTTRKKTKKIKMKKAAKKTYSKKGKTKTSKKTNKSSSSKEITTTETVTETSVLNKYKKGSKVNTRVTTIKTTVTRTVMSRAADQDIQQSVQRGTQQDVRQATQQVMDTSVMSLASKVDSRVSGAYSTLGFKIEINPNVTYSGLFDARTRTITLKRANDTIYHELGHFLAFMAGNMDTSADFQAIFNREKSKYTAYNKAYVLSSSSEYFAESFKNYTLDPAGLSASRPETYAAMQSALATLTSERISRIGTVYSPIWK